ncbi:CU044_2847 family protein [Actinomadura sp. NPDC000600]|uniref:CU044_2847 family protein n=1 Tax=Actinomadura sp. NPDC000600 TaxID=3154262 RepID=UPI003394CA74
MTTYAKYTLDDGSQVLFEKNADRPAGGGDSERTAEDLLLKALERRYNLATSSQTPLDLPIDDPALRATAFCDLLYSATGSGPTGRKPEVSDGGALKYKLDQVAAAASDMAKELRSKIDPMDPIEIELKFGMKVSDEADFIVAKCRSESAVEVTVRWR